MSSLTEVGDVASSVGHIDNYPSARSYHCVSILLVLVGTFRPG